MYDWIFKISIMTVTLVVEEFLIKSTLHFWCDSCCLIVWVLYNMLSVCSCACLLLFFWSWSDRSVIDVFCGSCSFGHGPIVLWLTSSVFLFFWSWSDRSVIDVFCVLVLLVMVLSDRSVIDVFCVLVLLVMVLSDRSVIDVFCVLVLLVMVRSFCDWRLLCSWSFGHGIVRSFCDWRLLLTPLVSLNFSCTPIVHFIDI